MSSWPSAFDILAESQTQLSFSFFLGLPASTNGRVERVLRVTPSVVIGRFLPDFCSLVAVNNKGDFFLIGC